MDMALRTSLLRHVVRLGAIGLVLWAGSTLDAQQLRMKKIAEIPDGPYVGRIICGDTDHDSLGEVIMASEERGNCWEIWEWRPMDRYEVVYADTYVYPYPQGVQTGTLEPWDIGDIDNDSFVEILGFMREGLVDSSDRWVVGTMETPTLHSYPESLSWWYGLWPFPATQYPPCYYAGDLDGDRRKDVYCPDPDGRTLRIFENCGNNQNRVAWDCFDPPGGAFAAFGDLDMDGRGEFVSPGISTAGLVWGWESVGDDTYELVWTDTVRVPNGGDALTGNDLDGDGKPELFITFAWLSGSMADFHLFMWEMTGNNTYERTLLVRTSREVDLDWQSWSVCADVNRDGADELVWSLGIDVIVLKATGNNQFSQVWEWHNPTQCIINSALVDVFDLNHNGLNEIVIGGILAGTGGYPEFRTDIYELEAVRLASPNGGVNLMSGDTCLVRWEVFGPTPCDSVALFLRTDTTWNLDTIATGLAPGDTPFVWIVPPGPLEPCHVGVVAYGQGWWQYDESDSAFKILPGVAEQPAVRVRDWSLAVRPNPARGNAVIRYDVPCRGPVSVSLCDASGRTVKTLVSGELEPGRYEVPLSRKEALPAGVYFVRLESGDKRLSRKVVLAE